MTRIRAKEQQMEKLHRAALFLFSCFAAKKYVQLRHICYLTCCKSKIKCYDEVTFGNNKAPNSTNSKKLKMVSLKVVILKIPKHCSEKAVFLVYTFIFI